MMDTLLDPRDILSKVREHHTQKEIAVWIGKDVRTIKRWEVKEDGPPPYAIHGLQQMLFTSGQRIQNQNDFCK